MVDGEDVELISDAQQTPTLVLPASLPSPTARAYFPCGVPKQFRR
jgi:hypothetical protein